MNVKGKNVVIYGGGISGVSAYELIKEKGGRALIYDDNNKPHTTSSAGVFLKADVIVLSPGVESGNPYVLDARLEGKTVVGEIELASSFCRAEQIAVTGTNGKTTTVRLIDHILKNAGVESHAVGNIGVAFSAICDRLDPTDVAVIEVSSFQLESAHNFAPDYAVLLNITPDHIQRHGSFCNYVKAKANVFLNQCECDVVVYNADDKEIQRLVPFMKGRKIPFSTTRPLTDGAYLSSGFVCYKGLPIIEIADVDVKGKEIENVLASVAVAMDKGISRYTVSSALCSFSRPKYRRTKICDIDKVAVYNDSKATNVFSTISAVDAMDGNTVLILGGAKGEEDFDLLLSSLKRVVHLIVCGDNAKNICDSAQKFAYEYDTCDNLEDAVKIGLMVAKEKNADNLLFSPASKSFDRYKNYEERGNAFDGVVKGIR
jgi:UDP-N-acetylmuramoylalanine--D-glutamate ligase